MEQIQSFSINSSPHCDLFINYAIIHQIFLFRCTGIVTFNVFLQKNTIILSRRHISSQDQWWCNIQYGSLVTNLYVWFERETPSWGANSVTRGSSSLPGGILMKLRHLTELLLVALPVRLYQRKYLTWPHFWSEGNWLKNPTKF